jgi:hypothetical protein
MVRRLGFLLLTLLSTPLAAQHWSTLGDLTVARTNMAAVYIGSGRVLVMGGSTGIPAYDDPKAVPVNTCEIVDVWGRRVLPAAPMSVARSEFVALRTRDTSVVVIGGVTGIDPNGQVTGAVELYDRDTGRWRTIGQLKTPRRQHVAGFIDEHRILVVGGRLQNYFSLTDAEIFDMRTGQSTPAAPFPYPINLPTLISSHSGELVVVGGRTGGLNSERRAEVYAYDPATDEWVLNSVLAQAVSSVSGLRLWDRRIIIAGGMERDEPARPGAEVQLENVGKWKLVAPMSRGRAGAALAQWSENRVLVLGGIHSDRAPVATTEWIDMSRHVTMQGPTMSVARDRFVALSVPAGALAEPHLHAIVAIGGLSGSGPSSSVEVLSPELSITTRVGESDELGNPFDGSLRPTEPTIDIREGERAMVAFNVPDATEMTLVLVSVDGRIIAEESDYITGGLHSSSIELSTLPSGTYFVHLRTRWMQRTWPVVLR